MTKANYKSTRLLVEAINKEMDVIRKAMMGNVGLPWGPLKELRELVDQLAEKADRPTLEEVMRMAPANYVATMKPFVAGFHRQLMVADRLAPCLCEDLQAQACVVILVGEGKTLVRAAHDPDRPEMALAVETVVALIEAGLKQVVAEGAAALPADDENVGPCQGEHDEPCGAADCYVLASIRRIKRQNEDEV